MPTATVLKSTPESVDLCGKLIRDGKLVAFPTETVYGLGANALDYTAVLRIYETKQRPLTDPVIVHIDSFEQALPLINPTPKEFRIFQHLTSTFWPGPLTACVRHSDKIHPAMAANTGYIGIRLPDHGLARSLIRAAGVPIAAPSANMFNHVSPTTAAHVFNDFWDKEVSILDEGASTLGIESTVVKVTEDTLYVYRLGSLPKSLIEEALKASPDTKDLRVEVVKKVIYETEETVSPGQFLKHYSPKIPSFILTRLDQGAAKKLSQFRLDETAIIDFGGRHFGLKDKLRGYFDLSPQADLKETMYRLYFCLREAEDVEGCRQILVTDLNSYEQKQMKHVEYLDCILDKVFRSCSGVFVKDDSG